MVLFGLVFKNYLRKIEKKDMANLIRCTPKGKMHLVKTKVGLLLITGAIGYILIYLPYMINYLKQSIYHAIILTSAKIIIFSVWYAITLRVVDPLSLATVANFIMVEVEDLNHYGVGLFDYGIDLFKK